MAITLKSYTAISWLVLGCFGTGCAAHCSRKATVQHQQPCPVTNRFETIPFRCDGEVFRVFVRRSEDAPQTRAHGVPIIVLHELPGLTHAAFEFAERVAAAGYTVYLPLLFGKPDRTAFLPNFLHVTFSRQWSPFSSHKTGRIAGPLRSFVDQVAQLHPGTNIAIVGMCFTGTLPLALFDNVAVNTAIVCQPATPAFRWTASRKAALNLSGADIATVRQRFTSDGGIKVLGVRFARDKLSPPERFDTLKSELGDAFIDATISEQECEVHHISRKAHAVLTADFEDSNGHPTRQRLLGVIELLDRQLLSRKN